MDNNNESGVSSVVGEMLMISIVLIIVAIFAASASQFAPQEREPSATIMVGSTGDSGHNVTLWHKGGDTLVKGSLQVILTGNNSRLVLYNQDLVVNNDSELRAFMPGDYMVVVTDEDVSGWDIQVVSSRSVLLFGRVED
ncbi:type IV pilin N-terminal domain-containing protein [Methanoplanus limicola]|nr:type IV pilin N-terminal domain-containing protein [Methanoplanus limicola]